MRSTSYPFSCGYMRLSRVAGVRELVACDIEEKGGRDGPCFCVLAVKRTEMGSAEGCPLS